jgi:glycosyltransferase involved in cell wall biosynthesis
MNASAVTPLRVLQVSARLDPAAGGTPASVVATSLALRNCVLMTSLAYVDVPERQMMTAPYVEVLRAAGVEIHAFPVAYATGTSGVRWGVSPRLATWLLRNAHRFDVLHVHGAWTFTTAASLLVARLRRLVAVLSPHESLTDFDCSKSGPLKRLTKRLLRRAYLALFDLVIVSSSLELQDSGDAAGRRCAVIPQGIGPIERTAPSLREPVHLRIGFLGRVDPKKNLRLLIEVIASLERDVLLVVAGDGPREYVEGLHRLARELGIADRVTWLGFVGANAKGDFLGSIDVLAMPSAYESFGVAAAEAMSAGVPVIVSPTVGVSDFVARAGAGIVAFPDRDVLAAAIGRFAVDRAFLDRAGARARSAAAEFSLERHGARLKREYLRLLAEAGRPTSSCVVGDAS